MESPPRNKKRKREALPLPVPLAFEAEKTVRKIKSPTRKPREKPAVQLLSPTRLFAEKFSEYRQNDMDDDFWMSPSKTMMKKSLNFIENIYKPVHEPATPTKEQPLKSNENTKVTPVKHKADISMGLTTPPTQKKLEAPSAPTHVRSTVMRHRIGDMIDAFKLKDNEVFSPSKEFKGKLLFDDFWSPSRNRKRQRT